MIKDDLMKLKENRDLLQKSAEVLKIAKAEFDDNNRTLLDQITKAKEEQSELINNIKKEALIIYKLDGEERKSIAYGVKIRNKVVLNYDEKDAFKWAQEHKIALKLDVSVFTKLALAQDIDFVTTETVPQVTILGKIEVD